MHHGEEWGGKVEEWDHVRARRHLSEGLVRTCRKVLSQMSNFRQRTRIGTCLRLKPKLELGPVMLQPRKSLPAISPTRPHANCSRHPVWIAIQLIFFCSVRRAQTIFCQPRHAFCKTDCI